MSPVVKKYKSISFNTMNRGKQNSRQTEYVKILHGHFTSDDTLLALTLGV